MTLAEVMDAAGGVVSTAAHRSLRNQFRRAIDSGDLVRLLPGVVVAAHLVDDPVARARAAVLWQPRGILLGRVAAHLTFWPKARVDLIDMTMPHTRHCPQLIRAHQRRIPADFISPWGPGLLTSPDLTVLDLFATDETAALCEGLRTRAVSLDSLGQAIDLLTGYPGAASRRRCLELGAGNPWSIPELDLHQLYRSAGITGWVGNRALRIGTVTVVPDITFEREQVLVEVDSREYHTRVDDFDRDHEKRNLVTAAGWRLLSFTPRSIWKKPDLVIAQTRALLCRGGRD